MSDESRSPRAPLSVLWILLVLPLAGGLGWLLGHVPEPAAKPQPAATVASPASGGEAVPGADASSRPTPLSAASDEPAVEAPKPDERRRDEYSQWTTYSEALRESERNGKPILLDFNAEWCPPCRRLKAEVFETPTLGQQVQSAVIPVSIVDRRHEEGTNPPETEALQNRYGVDRLPTLVVLSPKTGRQVKTSGYGGPQDALAWILESAKSVR